MISELKKAKDIIEAVYERHYQEWDCPESLLMDVLDNLTGAIIHIDTFDWDEATREQEQENECERDRFNNGE